MNDNHPTLAVIGGTGALGGALAKRLAAAGFAVVIGSRTADKARDSAARILPAAGAPAPVGMVNADAARAGDVIVLTVPFANHAAILDTIAPNVAGKLVIDATVPLVPPKVARVQLPERGSAAVICQDALGGRSRVTSAFHNIPASKLAKDGPVDCDVLVFGDDPADRAEVVDLIDAIGLRGLHGGALVNSIAAEAMTSVLIAINRRYKVADGAGLQITGDLVMEAAGGSGESA